MTLRESFRSRGFVRCGRSVENGGVMSGETVKDLLGEIASAGPSGGGGAAAALTGATAAALVALVAGVAARRAPDDSMLREIVNEADDLRARMLGLIDADVAAFGRVVEARRRTDDGRAAAVSDALIGATEVPLELAAASARVLEQCAEVLPRARPSTLADIGVAATLAAAALEGAALTARANLDVLPASAFVAESRRRLDGWLRQSAELRARLPHARQDSNS
jgi:methenyltetrahydrofolate cyclohydrolase